MRPNRSRYLILLAAGLLLAAVTVGVAIATSGGGNVPSAKQYAAGARARLASAPTSDQTSALAILARARNGQDGVPSGLAANLAQGSFTGLYGANVALARRVRGLASGAAWVVPGAGAVCLVAASATDASGVPTPGMPGGSGCEPDSSATTGQLYIESASANAPGEDFLAGIAPNGVSSVTVQLADGSSQVTRVDENVYLADVHGRIAGVRYSGPSGPVALEGLHP